MGDTHPSGTPARWSALPPLVLALLPFVLFAPAAFMREVFAAQDIQAYFYPYHALAARLVAEGHLPLWNPYVFSGIPLLADGQTALFYPPNWLFFVLPAETALNLVVLLQFSIAGVGMFVWARVLGLWSIPAFVAALAYMFGGFLSARVVHLSIMSGAALVPWLLLCLDRLLAPGGSARRWCGAMALALALQASTGHPQVPIYSALAVGLYAFVRVLEHARTGGVRYAGTALLRVALAYVLGYALAAVQLLPWIELARLSIRAAGTPYEFVFGTSTTGADWLLFLFPYLLGAHAASPFATGPFGIEQAVRVWEHSAYVGVLPLALALAGLGHLIELGVRPPRPDDATGPSALRHRWFSLLFLALLLILGLLLAAGWHTVLSRLVYATPVLGNLRAVERALVLAAFALASLAGLGLQRIAEPSLPSRRWLLAPAVLIVALPALFVLHAQLRPAEPLLGVPAADLARLSLRLPHTSVPLLFAGGAALLLGWWSRTRAGALTLSAAVALVLIDLAVYATSFTPTAPPRMYRVRPRVVRHMQPGDRLFRKATVLVNSNDLDRRTAQQALALSWAMVHGIEDVNGFNSLQPRRYTDYLFGAHANDVSYGYLRHEPLFRAENPVLSSLNVRYVLVPAGQRIALGPHLRQVYDGGRVRLYENTLAYPRAYFADRVRAETDAGAVLRQVTAPGFDGRRDALVEGHGPPALGEPTGPATADASRPGPNELVVATTAPDTRFLVVSEMYFPGWRAYVDGAETPIYRANYLFRGVVVPAGPHTVRFVYRPASVIAGAAITASALLVVGLLLTPRREHA